MVCQFQNSGSSPEVQLRMKKDLYRLKTEAKTTCFLQMSQSLQLPLLTSDTLLPPWNPSAALVAATVILLELKI